MDSKEGLRRIARIVSTGAWIWLAGWLIGAIVSIFGEPVIALACAISGIVGFACCQAVAWIISGFAGLPKGQDGLVRLTDIRGLFMREGSGKAIQAPLSELSGRSGVGGWLLLFMVILVLSAIRAIGAYLEASEMARSQAIWILETPYITALQIITSGSVFCLLGAYYLLLRVKLRSTINRAIVAIWLAGPLAVVVDTFCAEIWIPQLGSIWSHNVGTLAGSVIFALIWTTYLLKSRRVRNTYR